jgi:hypothetical protein
MSRSFVQLFQVAALTVFCSSSVLAQTSFGRVSGTVTDPAGAAVAGVRLVITNTNTQDSRNTTTDSDGFYVITNLAIGTYSIEATQTGFQKQQQKGLNVVADGRLSIDFQLQIGDVSQTVEVVGAATDQLNTVSGELAKTIDRKEVENLALNGGNYIQLITLVPGAVVTNPDQFSVTTSLSATNQTINGNRSDSQNLTVDGAFNLVAGSNGSLMNNLNANFIQEVKIQTSNMSAEYGRTAGPAFNVVTKSGTNGFHGGLFELFRNDALDARNFFSVTKTELRYNDFGFDVGGPIKKDKLFFFFGLEYKRLRQNAAPTRQTVPDTAYLNGNFAGASQLFYPGTKNPIPNNDISSMITADGKAIANVYRLMSKQASFFNDANAANNVILQPTNPLNFRQNLTRIDYRLNDKNSIYGRWVEDSNSLIDPFGTFSSSNLNTTPTQRNRPGESFLVAHTWLPTSSIVNEFRANASWASQNIPPYGTTWLRSTYGFQFPQLYGGGNYDNGIPDVAITGYANFKGPSFSLHSPSTDIQVADTVTYVRGQHIFKGGFAYIRDRVDQNGRPSYTGNLSFNTSLNTNTTGNALADALLGNFRTYSEASADPIGFFRFSQPGGFVQDSWRVRRNLSLELGMRWEMMVPFYTQANNMVNFIPSLYDGTKAVTITPAGVIVPNSGNPYDGLVRAGNGVPASEQGRVPGSTGSLFQQIPAETYRGLYDTQNVFAPRFGFAYSPISKTVIRGGYGMFYARPQGNLIFSSVNIPPILQTAQFENGNLANPSGGSGVVAPIANISAIDPNLKTGYSQQYSLSIQRELPKGMFAEMAYVGNLGRHLLRQPDINQVPFALNAANAALPTAQQSSTVYLRPYKGYSNITQFRSDSTSNYHALQTYLAKRTGNVFFTVSYTFAKSLGDSSGQGDNPESYLNRHYNYGPTSFDRRHAFIATYVWSLPRLQSWNVVARQVMGGWMLNGIIRLQSGQYYTITGSTSIGTRRADYLGLPIYPDGKNVNNWVNKAAFAPAPNDRLGNIGPGVVEGPALQNYDLSIGKNFLLTERFNLKFQADFFNAFNVANFNTLVVSVSDKAFGTLSNAYPPRNLQFTLKLNF